MTSPSTGTVRVSCDSSHQIQITLICADNCTNPGLITTGSIPLTVGGLDPGMMYSVIINAITNMFDDNQVVVSDKTVTLTITVMSDASGKFIFKCMTSMYA